MADLKIYITEQINLEGTDRGVITQQIIPDINNIDNRIITCPTGSSTYLFNFEDFEQSPGTFVTGSFRYGRITNKSSNILKCSLYISSGETIVEQIEPSSSYMFTSTNIFPTTLDPGDFDFQGTYIQNVYVEPSGSSAKIEYLIATT